MSQKAIFFIVALMFLICIGMWRYAVLWQAEQQLSDGITTQQSLAQPRTALQHSVQQS
jgi:hypothetical protein